MKEQDLINEGIILTGDECCIIFDFGCHFPYKNVEMISFDFGLGMEPFEDYKLNHRYPNKRYQTISQKQGRRVSKLGYPYVMKQKDQREMLLNIRIGLNDQHTTLTFPLRTNMTKERPVCELEFHYIFDKAKFTFVSQEKAPDYGYHQHIWSSHELTHDYTPEHTILLNPPINSDDDSQMLIYDTIITPYAQPWQQ